MNIFTDSDGITWGLSEELIGEYGNFKVACFDGENYCTAKEAEDSGALYKNPNTYCGRNQAYDAYDVINLANDCLGGRSILVFGMKGKLVWQAD